MILDKSPNLLHEVGLVSLLALLGGQFGRLEAIEASIDELPLASVVPSFEFQSDLFEKLSFDTGLLALLRNQEDCPLSGS